MSLYYCMLQWTRNKVLPKGISNATNHLACSIRSCPYTHLPWPPSGWSSRPVRDTTWRRHTSLLEKSWSKHKTLRLSHPSPPRPSSKRTTPLWKKCIVPPESRVSCPGWREARTAHDYTSIVGLLLLFLVRSGAGALLNFIEEKYVTNLVQECKSSQKVTSFIPLIR
jgi:hypothetical protein